MKKNYIVAGDPNSINSEIISKHGKNLDKLDKKNFLIANCNLINQQV